MPCCLLLALFELLQCPNHSIFSIQIFPFPDTLPDAYAAVVKRKNFPLPIAAAPFILRSVQVNFAFLFPTLRLQCIAYESETANLSQEILPSAIL